MFCGRCIKANNICRNDYIDQTQNVYPNLIKSSVFYGNLGTKILVQILKIAKTICCCFENIMLMCQN